MNTVRGPSRIVLVLEDDGTLRAVMEQALREHGYDVVSSAHVATTALPPIRPDVVVSDLLPMAAFDRVVAQRWLRFLADHYDAPVIAMSAHREVVRDALFLGVAGAFAKPFSLEELLECIDRAITGELCDVA